MNRIRRHHRRSNRSAADHASKREQAREERAAKREEIDQLTGSIDQASAGDEFDRERARGFAVLCAAAYHTEREHEAWLRAVCERVTSDEFQIEVFPENQEDTEGFALITEEAIHLIFCGTDSLRDWQTNLKLRLEWQADAYVHSGFWKGIERIWPVIDSVCERFPSRPIHLAGHSLGGALAIVATQRLRYEGRTVAGVHTFGQPLVGAGELQEALRDLESSIFRVVNEKDPVPLLPGLSTMKRLRKEEWTRRPRPGSTRRFQTVKDQPAQFEEIGTYLFVNEAGQIHPGRDQQTLDATTAASFIQVAAALARKVLTVDAHDIVQYAQRLKD